MNRGHTQEVSSTYASSLHPELQNIDLDIVRKAAGEDTWCLYFTPSHSQTLRQGETKTYRNQN